MLLRLFLAVEDCSKEVGYRGRQGFRPHGHGLHVVLERFGFLMCVLDGVAVSRVGFSGFSAFF